ncbi:MAG: hypothetical protein K6G40_02100 [Eubacterium sp.]|nr:hypothetical protein [Eubacterium sp.]
MQGTSLKDEFKKIWSKPLQRKVIIWIAAFLMASVAVTIRSAETKADLCDHLDDIIVTVDDEEICLQELSYYIMICEAKINAVAEVYDETDTMAFWNIYTNQTFIRTQAKEAAMNTCVRDCIYSHEADEAGVSLDEDELKEVETYVTECVEGLSYKQKNATQFDEESLTPVIERVYLARKYANMLLESEDFSDYNDTPNVSVDIGGQYYTELYESHEVVINEKLWKKISLGNITIEKVKV